MQSEKKYHNALSEDKQCADRKRQKKRFDVNSKQRNYWYVESERVKRLKNT